MIWIMFLFGIIVLMLGITVIYNAQQEKHSKDKPDKDKEDNEA